MLEELEGYTEQLEQGKLGLEESMEVYGKAIGALRGCQELLAQAREKISVLDAAGEPEDPGACPDPDPEG